MLDPHQLQTAYQKARDDLLAERVKGGHWIGRLASSALATATAISALAMADRHAHRTETASSGDRPLIEQGLRWLTADQNADGGWGDTDRSYSNIATTMLGVAAIHLADRVSAYQAVLSRAEKYLEGAGGLAGLRRRYGRDKTFAVPILTNYALAGLIDWREVAPLPFELAWVPQRFYRWMRMPVVSYAVPALVAIGQARFLHAPPQWPWLRWLRRAALRPTQRVLLSMQPDSGGYLEAVPLTSFVAMSLAATGRHDDEVTRRGLQFLRDSHRDDGSWPIDTNLATWTTSLAINALLAAETEVAAMVNVPWLLECQHVRRHPFTGASPGGWGWTDLSGAVPDADDTAGALLALGHLRSQLAGQRDTGEQMAAAAWRGIDWLLDLQNSDGGWPTFCRGWGRLPFDRSSADLTAHALRALQLWQLAATGQQARLIAEAMRRGCQYLDGQQRSDGSWTPLWFGNQDHVEEENPVYGTARVLRAYEDLGTATSPAALRGYAFLESAQRKDGGWSGCAAVDTSGLTEPASSVEETAVAVEALVGHPAPSPASRERLEQGLAWLVEAVGADRHRQPAPIGFYFAKLWYYEKLYPLVFTVAALGRAVAAGSGR